MVEVLKSNFFGLFPSIEKSIKDASFIAIDTEFTGLTTCPNNQASFFDSIDERYLKLKNCATNFTICQLGLTTFTKSINENSYSAETFTFYLRPHQLGSIDCRFMFQASCIDFLTYYEMDFNKFFYEGIPFLNEVQEARIKKEIQKGTLTSYHYDTLNQFKEEHHSTISDWLSKSKEGDETTLSVKKADYFHLYALRTYEMLWAEIKNSNEIVLRKVSLEKKKDLLKTLTREEEEKVLHDYLGFSHVFKALIKYKKVLVGHNQLMDLLLIYRYFYNPLPDSMTEFKQKLMSLFPAVYDTKYMWLHFKKHYNVGFITSESSLYTLYEELKSPSHSLAVMFNPSIEYKNCSKYATEFLPHNAGYDSFVTGWVFLKLCHIGAIKMAPCLEKVMPQTWSQHLRAVTPFKNKINISHAKIYFLDLAGDDNIKHRPDLLCVSLKDETLSLEVKDIQQKLGGLGFIEVRKISSTEALVAAASFKTCKQILEKMKDDEVFCIATYKYPRKSTFRRTVIWSSIAGSICTTLYLLFRLYKRVRPL